jgi:hypothetical protein
VTHGSGTWACILLACAAGAAAADEPPPFRKLRYEESYDFVEATLQLLF